MQRDEPQNGLGHVIALLAEHSKRPRYAFLVLQLIADAIDGRGRAGPFIRRGNISYTIRDWLVAGLMPLSSRDGRREAMRERVAAQVAAQLTGDPKHDQAVIAHELGEQARNVGRQNVSRAISDLVKAGLVTRHYAGYATNHVNRGAGRHAVYILSPLALETLGKAMSSEQPGTRRSMRALARQPDLFAQSACA
jgi:DNA-binding transcriptional ArsR family regulator